MEENKTIFSKRNVILLIVFSFLIIVAIVLSISSSRDPVIKPDLGGNETEIAENGEGEGENFSIWKDKVYGMPFIFWIIGVTIMAYLTQRRITRY